MAGPDVIDLRGARVFGGTAQRKEDVGISASEASAASSRQSAAASAAKLPGEIAAQKQGLINARIGTVREINAALRDETKDFDARDEVKIYRQGMGYFAGALNTAHNPSGDQDLITLAAKVQDPTGNVMEGDITRYNNLQTAIERIPAAFRNEFENTGRFSDNTRRQIRDMLAQRMPVYREAYQGARDQFTERLNAFNASLQEAGAKPINIQPVIGQDPYDIYKPRIEAYQKKVRQADIKAGLPPDQARADLFMGRPEGTVAPEPFKAPRLSADATAEITDYIRNDPNATPEGYARLVADKMKAEGLIKPEQEQSAYEGNLPAAQEWFRTYMKTPEQRQSAPAGLDYTEADKAAAARAGLTQTLGEAFKSIPESSLELGKSPFIIPADIIKSTLTQERVGTIKAFPDLAAELVKQMGGDPEGPMTQQFSKALEDRYGSTEGLKKYFASDPLGLIGDISMVLTAGGTAAARLPGAAGKVGRVVEKAGRVIDPLSGMVGVTEAVVPPAYRLAAEKAPGVLTGVQNAPSNVIGQLSGVGGATLR